MSSFVAIVAAKCFSAYFVLLDIILDLTNWMVSSLSTFLCRKVIFSNASSKLVLVWSLWIRAWSLNIESGIPSTIYSTTSSSSTETLLANMILAWRYLLNDSLLLQVRSSNFFLRVSLLILWLNIFLISVKSWSTDISRNSALEYSQSRGLPLILASISTLVDLSSSSYIVLCNLNCRSHLQKSISSPLKGGNNSAIALIFTLGWKFSSSPSVLTGVVDKIGPRVLARNDSNSWRTISSSRFIRNLSCSCSSNLCTNMVWLTSERLTRTASVSPPSFSLTLDTPGCLPWATCKCPLFIHEPDGSAVDNRSIT